MIVRVLVNIVQAFYLPLHIYYIVCFKARQHFKDLFPFFESSLQATVISFFICLEKYGSRLFKYAYSALEKT